MSVPSTEIKQQQRSLVESIRHPQMQAQLKASLPPSISLDRFTATTISAINHNPDLLAADRQSFYNAVVKAAADGLLPDGNDAVLNIYKTNVNNTWIKKVQYQRMVGGIIKQFAKAGIDAYAESVFEEDTFERWNDESGQHIVHRPAKLGIPKGARIGAYAVGRLASGRIVVQVMDMDELARARSSSKGGDGENAPWNKWPERMEQKSALHRLRKRIAILDEKAADELRKIDEEFDDDPPETTGEPAQTTPPQSTDARPKALQSVIDQVATPQTTTSAEPVPSADPGPGEGDII